MFRPPLLPYRWHRLFLVVLFVAAVLVAIGGSLFTIEPVGLGLLCCLLAIPVVFGVFSVRSQTQFVAGLVAIATLISIAWLNWPLRLVYRLHRQAFDRVAQQVRAGQAPRTPFRIGIFRITATEVNWANVVCLWTDPRSSGSTGFIQHGPENLPVNLWSHTPLDQSWQFVSED